MGSNKRTTVQFFLLLLHKIIKLLWSTLKNLKSEVVGIDRQGNTKNTTYKAPFSLQTASTQIDFCYKGGTCGPATWLGACKAGRKQSPINIETSRVKIRLQSTRFVLNRNYIGPKSFYLKNTGHTVQLSLNRTETSKSFMFGDGLGQPTYYFSQLHFHWGANIREGSEHRISGKRYPLEMHMVHYQLKNPKKIAVVAVLFYISPRDNPNLRPIIRNLANASNFKEIPKPIKGFKVTLTSLLPKRMRMFRYIGSLTTPPCTENVLWTVFQDPLPISRRQLAAFRKLQDFDARPMRKNFRPIQPIYNRRNSVYFLRTLKSSGWTF